MTDNGDRLAAKNLPTCDLENPAEVEAWFGNFGYAEPLRKCVLSNCKEIVRARYTLANEKISETRIDDLARLHDNYLDFLVSCLEGRTVREVNFRAMAGA